MRLRFPNPISKALPSEDGACTGECRRCCASKEALEKVRLSQSKVGACTGESRRCCASEKALEKDRSQVLQLTPSTIVM
jgi:hypothetical protein